MAGYAGSQNIFFLFFFLLMFNDGDQCGDSFAENGLFFMLLIFLILFGGMGSMGGGGYC